MPSSKAGWTMSSTRTGTDETGQLLSSLAEMQTALRAREETDADSRGQIGAINRAQAVIEFDMDGMVAPSTTTSCGVMGYSAMKSSASITACSSIRACAGARLPRLLGRR